MVLSPILSGKLNSTQLDRSVQFSQFSWVQFSAVHWTSDDRRPPSRDLDSQESATAVAGRGRRNSSPVQCTARNWTEQFSLVFAARCYA